VKDTEPTHGEGQPIITKIVVDETACPMASATPTPRPTTMKTTTTPMRRWTMPSTSALFRSRLARIRSRSSCRCSAAPRPRCGTLDNKKVFAAWDSATSTLIGYVEGTDPNDAANQVFKMHITDAQTGAYEFELLQAVKHANSDIFIDDNTENVLNLPADFIVVAEIEDKDCDVTYSKGHRQHRRRHAGHHRVP
jgi:hypothetical protein